MKKLTLVIGGTRSGKSGYAVELAKKLARSVVFIATASSLDEEMQRRIRKHQAARPRQWKVIEEGKELGSILPKLKNKCAVVIIDCLGLWLSNLLADGLKDKAVEKKIKALMTALRKVKLTTIIVSNEVGLGIVPDNLLARRFGDLLGLVNQLAAKAADEVIFMRAGIPTFIKGGGKNGKVEDGLRTN